MSDSVSALIKSFRIGYNAASVCLSRLLERLCLHWLTLQMPLFGRTTVARLLSIPGKGIICHLDCGPTSPAIRIVQTDSSS
jgi:hypothetical protein